MVRVIKVVEGATVALKPKGGVEEAVAVMAEIVACGAFVVLQCAHSVEAMGAVIAGGHNVGSSAQGSSCLGTVRSKGKRIDLTVKTSLSKVRHKGMNRARALVM